MHHPVKYCERPIHILKITDDWTGSATPKPTGLIAIRKAHAAFS